MEYYKLTIQETLNEVKSGIEGLSTDEATSRLAKNGKNALAAKKKTSAFKRLLKQLADPMILILLIAAIVSLALTLVNNLNPANENESFADVIIIAIVVILNAVLGVIQESKAEKALESLQNMATGKCRVVRGGEMLKIDSCDLTVGDIVLLEAGDSVPADLRVIESHSLKAEESALTGESVPVLKHSDKIDGNAALGDRKNMLYLGSTVVYGRAEAVVVATGANTEMGKIADFIASAKEEKTPLQLKMSQLSKILTYVVIGISIFIFGFKLIMDGFAKETVLDSLFVAIGLAVAAIPEGLATVVTIVLSIGVTNMSKKNAVIRKLTAVETLGSCEIICSDKTGTLTQNVMTVVETYADDEKLLKTANALCADAALSNGKAVGEPTECALVNYACSCGYDKTELEKQTPRIDEAPFDSERKMMSTVHKTENGFVQYTKGAVDVILSRCTHAIVNGKTVKLTREIKERILSKNKRMADKALRVLAFAYVNYKTLPQEITPDSIEREMTFIGLSGMIDPVRPEVMQAIKQCKKAGIRPIMITGDHIDTAVAIAKELDIITDSSEAILGAELDDMTDEQFEKAITIYSVYARVQPEHKARIVNAWKKLGKVCAMTGDGVNDVPSIKAADIGVGMGITGTDVTKNTADMILTDDNFATIVTAVNEGRRIYDNIRKAIQFLLSSNLAEVISVFAATVCGFTLLKPAHLLWINLITDTFPAIALGTEKAEPDIMNVPPRSKKENIFARGLGINIVVHGLFVSAITLAAYFIGCSLEHNGLSSEQGMTMAFITMSMTEIFHAYNARSMHKSIFKTKSHNKLLWIAMCCSLALTTAVVFVPYVNTAFGFANENGQAIISWQEYIISLALAFSIVPLVEIQKLIMRAISKRKNKIFSEI